MTQANTTPNEAPDERAGKHGRRGRRGRVLLAATLATGIGFFAGGAMSHGFHHFGGHFGHHSGLTRVLAPATVDEASDRAGRMARHLAVEIDATPEQQTRLVEIARKLATDVYPVRQQMKEARQKGLDLMRAPTIDRAAVEGLRAEQMAKVDAISQRVATALADAAEVMTPAQRTKLAQRIEDFRQRFGWWKHWRHD